MRVALPAEKPIAHAASLAAKLSRHCDGTRFRYAFR